MTHLLLSCGCVFREKPGKMKRSRLIRRIHLILLMYEGSVSSGDPVVFPEKADPAAFPEKADSAVFPEKLRPPYLPR